MRKILVAIFITVFTFGCKDERSELGDKYFQQGKYAKAVEAYTEYLKLEPTHIKSLYNRGRAYEELNRYDEALKDFHKIIKEDPLNANAFLSITSDYYYRKQDYENTIFYADKTLKLNENSPVAHTLKGKAYQKLGNLNEALAAYNAALSVDKEFADAYLSRGLLRVHLRQTSRACSDFQMAGSLGAESASDASAKYCR